MAQNPFLDGQESVGELTALLGHSNLRVRRAAIAGLAGRDPAETLSGLLVALADTEDATVRSSAADVLMRYREEALPGLMRALDPVRRRDLTIQVLVIMGKIPSRETVEAVIPLARHADPSVAAAAIGCLGALKDPSCVPTLLSVLDSGERWQTFYAIDALGEVGHAAAVSRLIPLVAEPYYRKAVLRAMGRIGDEAAIRPLVNALVKGTPCPDRTALIALNEMVERARIGGAREVLVNRIVEEIERVRSADLFQGLKDLIGRSDGDRKRYALRALGWCQDQAAIPCMVESLAEPLIADLAVEALRDLAREHARSILNVAAEAVLSADAIHRLVEIIGLRRDPAVDSFLRRHLEHEEDIVRQAAAAAMAADPQRDDLEALVCALGDISLLVSQEAVKGLLSLATLSGDMREEVSGRVEGLTASSSAEMRCAALAVIADLGSEGTAETLDLALHDPAASVRRTAVSLLGESADPQRLWRLTVALADEDARVREEAVAAVGRLRDDRARGVLLAALQDRSIWVRCQAAQALADHAAVEVQAALEEAARRETPPVRVSAICALGRLWPESSQLLRELAGDPDPEIRRAVLRALGAGGETVPIEMMAAGLEDQDWSVRCAAATSLGESGHAGAFIPLARAMDRERDAVARQALLRALYHAEPESALSYLVSALAEKDVAETAAALLMDGQSVFSDDLRAAWASAEDPAVREGLAAVLRESAHREASSALDAEPGGAT
ncbi:MAG: HEAT repeat domain-containing protein [Acidobacteria bacterium]|nr:HEAT repeat domain-containing protein [Acidobacteriota bacterium]